MKLIYDFISSQKIDDEKLRHFVYDRIKTYGGLNLVRSIKATCLEGRIEICTTEDYAKDVHVALFIVENYHSIKCQFTKV